MINLTLPIPICCTACGKRFKKGKRYFQHQTPFRCPGCGAIMILTLEDYARYLTQPLIRPETPQGGSA